MAHDPKKQPHKKPQEKPGTCPTPGEHAETGKKGAGNLSPGGASRTGGATSGVAPKGAPTDRSTGAQIGGE